MTSIESSFLVQKGTIMIKVGVVGSGYWGKNLVRNFHALGALGAICDRDPGVLENFQEMYKGIPTFVAFDDLFSDSAPALDALAIATPAETHYELAMKSLLAGKHVFVEKPVALTVEEGLELITFAEQKNLTLMVGHILHYHPAVIKLKELIDSGELGKIQYLYSNRLNIGKIRAEENILWSFAPHDISVILMLLGEMPESVYATGGTYLQKEIPDTTLTNLNFASGVKAHIFVSWLHPFKEQKLVVVGDRKMAVLDDVSEEKLVLYPHQIQWVKRIPVAAKAQAEVVAVDMEEPLKAECQHFLECISKGRTPRTDGREGLRVLQILQASQESLNQDSRIVRLNRQAESELAGRQYLSPEPAESKFFVHESSYVDDGVEIGAGTRIWHFSHILRDSRIGRNCTIGQNVVIGPDVTIGNGCKIQNNVSVYKGVTLEDGVFCGPSMVFTNVHNPRAHIGRMDEIRATVVKKGASLGANCTVICGNDIGRFAFVGAGAVVTKDVPDYALVMGMPARIVGWVCECGEQLSFAKNKAKCAACGNGYRQAEEDRIESETQ
ncbi:MAG: Gfo/Idh/MocA family oxidoreductase [Syntrophobacterales bacterium]|jgi:UDP-2-acetamido-3-amino-2,3-dideoxy-glucuronate N-acetyltransferase